MNEAVLCSHRMGVELLTMQSGVGLGALAELQGEREGRM